MAIAPRTAGLDPRELAAWRGFLRVHARLVSQLDAELEASHGLPLTSYEVLIALADAPGQRLRMAELADRVLLSRSGMTRLVDRLQREGLIERARCEQDARGAYAALTEKGRRLLAVARPAHLDGVRRRFHEQLAAEDLDALAAVWEKLVPGAAQT